MPFVVKIAFTPVSRIFWIFSFTKDATSQLAPASISRLLKGSFCGHYCSSPADISWVVVLVVLVLLLLLVLVVVVLVLLVPLALLALLALLGLLVLLVLLALLVHMVLLVLVLLALLVLCFW